MGKLVLALTLWVVSGVFLSGLVFQVLWGWFVVPSFGVPALSFPAALGLALLVSYATQGVGYALDEDSERVCTMLIAKPVLGLSLGWVIHLFV